MTLPFVHTAVLSHHSPVSQTTCPPEGHSVASIPADVEKLYDGLLAYAAVSPSPEKSLYPSRSFLISTLQPRQRDAGIENNSQARYKSWSSRRPGSMMATPIPSGTGQRRAQAEIPMPIMDLGNTAVTWPPPEHLVPKFLKPEMEGGSNPYCFPDSKEEQRIFHVTHYELGEPKLAFHGTCKSMRWVRVTTAHGDEALQHFLASVLQWVLDCKTPDHRGAKYNLYRFRTDPCGNGSWAQEGSRNARSPESVVLDEGQMPAILDDVEQFLKPETRLWYKDHGLPARRSYLFEGPPGTGKTSTIRVIAGQFGLTCCFLAMTNEKFSNQQLADALSEVPSNALLVLEDIDSLFRKDRSSQNSSSLTFSGLLNVLDGVTSLDGLVTVMTTNHPERLDPALIRGGRVDRRFRFEAPKREQYGKLFKLFYKEANDEMAEKFAEGLVGDTRVATPPTIATLQQLFIQYRGKPAEECLAGLGSFVEEHVARVQNSHSEQPNATEEGNGDC